MHGPSLHTGQSSLQRISVTPRTLIRVSLVSFFGLLPTSPVMNLSLHGEGFGASAVREARNQCTASNAFHLTPIFVMDLSFITADIARILTLVSVGRSRGSTSNRRMSCG